MPPELQIEPLPPINHDDMDYDEFAKDLYEPTDEVLKMMEAQVRHWLRSIEQGRTGTARSTVSSTTSRYAAHAGQ